MRGCWEDKGEEIFKRRHGTRVVVPEADLPDVPQAEVRLQVELVQPAALEGPAPPQVARAALGGAVQADADVRRGA